jgi:endonuclease/exonuclease/phosphatase family metal-dependent hydrolase
MVKKGIVVGTVVASVIILLLYVYKNGCWYDYSFDTAPAYTHNDRTRPLRVATLNTAMITPQFVGMGSNVARMRHILDRVPSLDIDVLCLQEVFDPCSQKALTVWCQINGWYCSIDTEMGRFLIGSNSGLAILSRYPIQEANNEAYSDYAGDEFFARKGIRHIKVITPQDTYHIYNTHLQTGGIKKSSLRKFDQREHTLSSGQEIKKSQVAQALKFVTQHGSRNAMLCGDFNLNHTEVVKLARESGLTFPLRDTFARSSSQYHFSNSHQTERIDLILDISGELTGSSTITNHFGRLTDHLSAVAILD